jgi:hypothetical protein
LGDVGQGAGWAAVHAAGGYVGEKLSKYEIEGDGVLEIAAESEEFGADFLDGLELEEFAIVEEAEFEVRVTEHAAAAAVGELEIATRVWIAVLVLARLFGGHGVGARFVGIFCLGHAASFGFLPGWRLEK